MVRNTPNPADINPENIVVNAFRLRGKSPEIGYARVKTTSGTVSINAPGEIDETDFDAAANALTVRIAPNTWWQCHVLVCPVDEPASVEGAGDQASSESELSPRAAGWVYVPELRGVVLKLPPGEGGQRIRLAW